jgi:hypothetical protein
MSKIFYDDIVSLDKVEKEINRIAQSHDEKIDLWQIVDEILHHKVIGCVLDRLPRENHEEFLDKFHKAPHDRALLKYLASKIKDDIRTIIKNEAEDLVDDILREVQKQE